MNIKKICLIACRILLGILIVANMAVIFYFSAEPNIKSGETGMQVGTAVLEKIDKVPETKSEFYDFLAFIRKCAHLIEFGSLGALVYLFLLTWKNHMLPKYFASLGFSAFYAATDEIHQLFVEGRKGAFSDVLIDTLGAFITCTVILAICFLSRHESQGLKTTTYRLPAPRPELAGMRIAVAADLHGNDNELPLRRLREARPDIILIPGDLTDDTSLLDPNAPGYDFLHEAVTIAPTYYSVGNHEIACYHKGNPWRHPVPHLVPDHVREQIAETGAVFLDNDYVTVGSLTICGLTSGINRAVNRPHAETLARFAALPGVRILLCHHPEYFVPFIKETDIELTVSGHAHGGHWRLFGRGIYAPGQGLFPKYTSGVLDGRCVISRGMGNHTTIPRIFNKPELVVIEWI